MKLWRLGKREYKVPNGEGAKKYGGRWNPPGMAVVYTSVSLSLATLEALVHADSDLLPIDLVIISADLPDNLVIETVLPEALPPNWEHYPAPLTLQAIGADWLRTNKTVGLQVPSAVVSQEHNVLLNPAHPKFSKIHWEEVGPFQWDLRLSKKARS